MSTSIHSAGEPGAPRCSESATGPDEPTGPLAVALRALESADESLAALHELGEVIANLLSGSTDDDAARAVLQGHRALALEACHTNFSALQQLGQRGAA